MRNAGLPARKPERSSAPDPQPRPHRMTRRTLIAGAAMTLTAQPTYRLIDPHVHVWKHDPAFPFAQGANVPARDAAPETLLELMRANGVERTVLIQYIAYRWDNAFVLSVLKKYPGTFQVVARVNPEDP